MVERRTRKIKKFKKKEVNEVTVKKKIMKAEWGKKNLVD